MKPKRTQAQRILQRLKQEGELTNVQLNDMHVYRYAARIMELRRQGHKIISIRERGGLWKFRYVPEDKSTSDAWYGHADSVPIGGLEDVTDEPEGGFTVSIELAPATQLSMPLGDSITIQRDPLRGIAG